MNIVHTDLFYLPNLEYFCLVKDFGEIRIHLEDRYVKQTYRNRCEILLANKVEKLSVPVKEGKKNKPFRTMEIDYAQKWLHVHLRGIQSAYGKAPYFEYLYPELEAVFKKYHRFLWELNLDLLTICLRFLNARAKLVMHDVSLPENGEVDLRGALDAKTEELEREFYCIAPYTQVFGVDFVPNLSVIDLLFCQGPEAKYILDRSIKKKLNNT
ncbi:MAG: WbqC family protein [Lunatimonas sp.]|uniref:WbqC family protein n=1 Tax=Lunatimonas sp. TaxID=2060141 RepID=UPI00263B5A33|nr:WbqC family protein [Lunatimonas sp.]MCC5936286.1 WbqC family protein [Lunatimonas sp.]